MSACRPWLEAEIELVSPSVVVALGATPAHSLMGRATAIGANRGRPLESPLHSAVVVTAHPSSVLRECGEEERHAALAAIVEDLGVAADLAADGA